MLSSKTPVLFDTDIGSDIDDALCLTYLLMQPKCDLLGITTVSGDPVTRAKLASCICRRINRDNIPIHPGAALPFIGVQDQLAVPQAAALEHWSHRQDFEVNSAIPFLRDTIRSRPGEITLLAVGPMTNIGMLFALYPDIPKMLKSVVLMCGSFFDTDKPRRNEWNAKCDYTATDVVFRSAARNLVSVGLDVSMQCSISGDEARQKIRGGVLDPVADMASVWLSAAPGITFHDPLTAAFMFEPSLCQTKRGNVSVDTTGEALGGITEFKENSRGRHKVASTVDSRRFLDHYFSVTRRG